MAKKHEWQPLLLDLGPSKAPGTNAPAPATPPTQERIEYDTPGPKRRPKAEVERRETYDHTPWWERVQQMEGGRTTAATDESWGRAWRGLLLGEGWTLRLKPARQAELESAVRGVDVRSGVVEAGTATGREKPHRVQLRLTTLAAADWARLARQIVDDGAEDVLRRDLAARIVPFPLVDAADRHSMPLVPRRATTVVAACTCGGARLPCDHVVATHLAFARQLDTDPLLLLTFRGGSTTDLLALVERVRDGVAAGVHTKKAGIAGDPFSWGEGPPPDLKALEGPCAPRAPLVSPDGWRARETFDAVVKRLVG